MQLPIRVDKAARESLQTQVASQVRQLILDGRLAPGTQMPASRNLARDLAVSRNTVMGAFARLVAEGLLETREPTGTFVTEYRATGRPDAEAVQHSATALRAPRQRARIRFHAQSHVVVAPHGRALPFDFWVGRPDARLFPLRAWRRLLTHHLDDAPHHLCDYGDPQGLYELREAICGHVGATRGIATDPDHILITNGIQEGLNLLAVLLTEPGVPVAIENPCYLGAAHVFARHGAALHSVQVDAHGIDPERLPPVAALAYVTPSHQYPMGGTLSLARRSALLRWAADCGAYIAEDDYDSDFFYDSTPLPALKSLDRYDQVIYLGTFSKSLGAGLRVGYMVLPAELCQPARNAKALLNNCQPWLTQAVLADFIGSGEYARHVRRLRQTYTARCAQLRAGLAFFMPQWRVHGAGSGMHLVAHLPADGPRAHEVEARARSAGVGIYAIANGNAHLHAVADDDPLHHVLLLGYASLSESEISGALLRLRNAVGGRAAATAPA